MRKITPGLFGLAAVIAAVALLVAVVIQQRDGVAVAPTEIVAQPAAKATETPFGRFDGRPVYERQSVDDLVPEERDWELKIAFIVLDDETEQQIESAVIDFKIKTPSGEEIFKEQSQGTILTIKGGTVVLWKASAGGYEALTEWSGAKFVINNPGILVRIRLKPLSPQT